MNQSDISVSVIIPVFNRADTVGEAIESVLSQTSPANEVIVVDDGSEDDLAAVLAPFGDRIIVIRQDNAGASAARNTGIGRASGKWLTFLDSDDVWVGTRLEILRRDLAAAPDKVTVHLGDVVYVGPGYEQSLFTIKNCRFDEGTAALLERPLDLVISGMTLQGAAIRRDAFHRTGGFDPKLPMFEDTGLFCKLAIDGTFLVTGEVVAHIRRLSGDEIALTSLLRKDPVRGREMRVKYMEPLLKMTLTPAQDQLVRRQLSGALFLRAEAESLQDPGQARRTLLRAARLHPSLVKGWAKSLIALMLGRKGFTAVQNKNLPLDRS